MNRITEAVAAVPLRNPPSPLHGARFQLEVQDLLATLTVEQEYRNAERQPIEVSYLCAIPHRAQLLEVWVELNGQVLQGRIEPRADAEQRYEQALAEGQSAFCVRLVDDHLLHVALGNLLPGETLRLRLKYGWWLQSDQGQVRLTIPTTLAPRYGQPRLEDHVQTHSDLLVQYPASLEGRLRGSLAACTVASPSHRLSVRCEDAQLMHLQVQRASLDRDIVIDIRRVDASAHSSGSILRSLDECSAMLAFCAPAVELVHTPVLAQFVLDCSGSMAGSSMQQARAALQAIVAQLGPADRFNVLRFGSHHELLLRRPQALTPVIRNTIQRAANTLEADLGGTELMSALHAALENLQKLESELPGERVLFIVSDGEVWNPDISQLVAECAQAKVRIFAVAVGNAAVQSTFEPMVEATGGALERVLPGDDMAQRIERHFQRVRQGALRKLEVSWPGQLQPLWVRSPGAVYSGDTALFAARLDASAAVQAPVATVSWEDPAGARCSQQVRLVADETAAGVLSDTCRMVAALRLPELEQEMATGWAVRHQLMSEWTGLTIVQQRSADAGLDALPELRVVPQMMAAGWGGLMEAAPCLQFALGALPPLVGAPPPVPAPMVEASLRTAVGGARAKLRSRSEHADQMDMPQAAGPSVLEHLQQRCAELLAEHLSEHMFHVERIAQGQFGIDDLAVPLPLDLLNWLDDLAESLGLSLSDGRLWQALAAHLAGRHPKLAQWLSELPPGNYLHQLRDHLRA